MPEICNIQTYVKVDEHTYLSALEHFAKVLEAIGLWNDKVVESFSPFKWDVDINGSISSTFTGPDNFKSFYSDIPIWPYAFVCLLDDVSPRDHQWMAFHLYIEAESLKNYTANAYYTNTYEFVKSLSLAMHSEFNQTGVYFTDEMLDMEELDVFTHNNLSKLWQFDYAIIPLTLEQLYANPPLTHAIIKHEHHLEAWDVERWKAH